MTCKEIIKKYLADNGYDGLCNDECGCCIDGLMPCGMADPECHPGYAYNINRDETCKGCVDKCPFFDIDGWIAEYGWICSLENLPVKCRVKKEAANV